MVRFHASHNKLYGPNLRKTEREHYNLSPAPKATQLEYAASCLCNCSKLLLQKRNTDYNFWLGIATICHCQF